MGNGEEFGKTSERDEGRGEVSYEVKKKSLDIEGIIDELFKEWDFTPSEIKRAIEHLLELLESQARSYEALETATRIYEQ